jgi:hypothetical protein
VSGVRHALNDLDDATAVRVLPALDWFVEHDGSEEPDLSTLRRYLTQELGRAESLVARDTDPAAGDSHEAHETAWALGDLFERAGLPGHAALCRSAGVHEVLSVRRWTSSFPDVPPEFWRPAMTALDELPDVPERVRLSLVSATGLLSTAAGGVTLTPDGHLPSETVLALDDRFRWTEEFPWMRTDREVDVPPLLFLHQHLTAQRLLARDGRRLTLTAEGAASAADPARLWRRVVTPAPRWTGPFERDTLGVMAASLLRSGTFSPGRVAEELAHVLAARWQAAPGGAVFDQASLVVQAWYQLGVPLGWWDSGRGPADRRPNAFGRAAAARVLRSVAAAGPSGE